MPTSKSLTALMSTTPDNLATQQKIAIKQHVASILEKIVFLLAKEDFAGIREMCLYSPAGDCMGSENHFIDFSWAESQCNIGVDIIEVVDLLEKLTEQENVVKEEGGMHRVINR